MIYRFVGENCRDMIKGGLFRVGGVGDRVEAMGVVLRFKGSVYRGGWRREVLGFGVFGVLKIC